MGLPLMGLPRRPFLLVIFKGTCVEDADAAAQGAGDCNSARWGWPGLGQRDSTDATESEVHGAGGSLQSQLTFHRW